MECPLISIYIPTKDRKDLLVRAIKSCLDQTFKDFEIIVVDDGSEDNSYEFINKEFGDSRLRVFRNPESVGGSASRNVAIKHARGKFLTGLDDDDIFRPERLEKFVEYFDDQYSFICANMLYQERNRLKLKGFHSGVINQSRLFFENVVGNQIFVERSKLLQVGGFDETLTACQDYDLWMRLVCEYGDALKIREATYVVDEGASTDRITSSPKAFRGYYDCYCKHKSHFSTSGRIGWLLRIREIQGKRNNHGFYLKLFFQNISLKIYLKFFKTV